MRSFILLTLLLLLPVLLVPNDLPKHLKIAYSYIGTTEATGHNDGVVVEYILKRQGGAKGASYCSYFVSMCIDSAVVKEPSVRPGMAIGFKRKNSIPANDVLIGKTKIPPGTIIVWKKGESIHGHVGLVYDWGKRYGTTVEGNTSSGQQGSQANGDGIWMRKRSIEPMNYFRIICFTLVKY
jgi:hypothetical protein